MSVTQQIKKDWDIAIKKSIKPKYVDRSDKIQIIVSKSTGDEYYFDSESETEDTIRIWRGNNEINATVFKRAFKKRWVNKNYILHNLKQNR